IWVHIVLGLRMPVQHPCVVQILTRYLPFQTVEHTVWRCEVRLEFLLPEIIDSEIDLSIEPVHISVTIPEADTSDRSRTHIAVHTDHAARPEKRRQRGIHESPVCRARIHDALHPGTVERWSAIFDQTFL